MSPPQGAIDELKRAIEKWIFLREDSDLPSHPMVFLSGPRQSGKTFWAKRQSPHYFNWDTSEVKKAFLKDAYFFRDRAKTSAMDWVTFDEI